MSWLQVTASQGREPTERQADIAERHLGAKASAVLRLLLLPILFLGNHLVAHPDTGTSSFDVVLAVAAVYSFFTLATALRGGQTGTSEGVKLVIDLLLISALAFTSGPGFRQIRAVFIVAPMVAAFRLSPWRTAAMSAATYAAYIVVAFTHPIRQHLPVVAVLAHSMFILWSGTAAVVMSTLRERRQRRILALSEARGRLVADTIESEERIRKRLSGLLHDHVVQDLLTARQDLADARTGDPDALGRVDHAIELALGQLRTTIEDLDPYLLDHLDLATALSAIAEREGRHASYRAEISVQPDASGVHDALIASLARELLSNTAKHAKASLVTLQLTRRGDHIVLHISDNGRGFTPAQALAALRAGHIGLAAAQERIEAINGSFVIDSAPGVGTNIRCMLPTSEPPSTTPVSAAAHRPSIDAPTRTSRGRSQPTMADRASP